MGTKFSPATKDGKPVAGDYSIEIAFARKVSVTGIYRPRYWTFPDTGPKTLPPQFQYDHPPKITRVIGAVYPLELLKQGTKGSADVAFALDPTGIPHVFRVENASRPEFGEAAKAAVNAFGFDAATQAGKPCWAILHWHQSFDPEDDFFPLSESAGRVLNTLRQATPAVVADPSTLDQPLVTVYEPDTIIPAETKAAKGPARAVIEVVVDSEGHAQLPRIVYSSDSAFGWAAATAVNRRLYTVPHQHGTAVYALLRVPVLYKP